MNLEYRVRLFINGGKEERKGERRKRKGGGRKFRIKVIAKSTS